MNHRQHKTACFALEGLNALASSFYFNYLFFFMRERFAFGNKENLALTVLHGLVYMCFAALGGSVAQKRGCHFALRAGFGLMGLSVAAGGVLVACGCEPGALKTSLVVLLALWTFGMSFTWPALEAMATEGESGGALQQMVGIYNLVWAAASAAAYFCGGALVQTLGWWTLFWIPAAISAVQVCGVAWLARNPAPPADAPSGPAPGEPRRPAGETQGFLRLAWISNPLAYIAMNALLPVIPQLAHQLGLSTRTAGFVCSVWMFARLAAFWGLWKWAGWHYRFGWLMSAYAAMAGSFALILLAPRLEVILAGQVVFGLAVGLIYYSSLYYSMDQGDTKSEHGGLHEAAIGAGVFGGPAIGWLAMQWRPGWPNAGVWAVSTVLAAGFGLLVWTRRSSRSNIH